MPKTGLISCHVHKKRLSVPYTARKKKRSYEHKYQIHSICFLSEMNVINRLSINTNPSKIIIYDKH